MKIVIQNRFVFFVLLFFQKFFDNSYKQRYSWIDGEASCPCDLGFGGDETNCRIVHILSTLLMTSCSPPHQWLSVQF